MLSVLTTIRSNIFCSLSIIRSKTLIISNCYISCRSPVDSICLRVSPEVCTCDLTRDVRSNKSCACKSSNVSNFSVPVIRTTNSTTRDSSSCTRCLTCQCISCNPCSACERTNNEEVSVRIIFKDSCITANVRSYNFTNLECC